MQEPFGSEVLEIIDEAPHVKRFFLQRKKDLSFTAGQHIKLHLPLTLSFIPAFSIASSPSDTEKLELIISWKGNNPVSDHLFHQVKAGDILNVTGPFGTFHMTTEPGEAKELCFIGTGTGIAPLRSMLLDTLAKEKHFKSIRLIMGYREKAGILYNTEMEELQKRYPNFHFIPVLSREEDTHWTGERGHVHHVYKKLYEHKAAAEFYLCGWKEMIKKTMETLTEAGFSPDQVHYEKY